MELVWTVLLVLGSEWRVGMREKRKHRKFWEEASSLYAITKGHQAPPVDFAKQARGPM